MCVYTFGLSFDSEMLSQTKILQKRRRRMSVCVAAFCSGIGRKSNRMSKHHCRFLCGGRAVQRHSKAESNSVLRRADMVEESARTCFRNPTPRHKVIVFETFSPRSLSVCHYCSSFAKKEKKERMLTKDSTQLDYRPPPSIGKQM